MSESDQPSDPSAALRLLDSLPDDFAVAMLAVSVLKSQLPRLTAGERQTIVESVLAIITAAM